MKIKNIRFIDIHHVSKFSVTIIDEQNIKHFISPSNAIINKRYWIAAFKITEKILIHIILDNQKVYTSEELYFMINNKIKNIISFSKKSNSFKEIETYKLILHFKDGIFKSLTKSYYSEYDIYKYEDLFFKNL